MLWSSFLAAGVASMLFFAAVDPLMLRDAGPQRFENLSREAGYGLGFLFFWALAAGAAALMRVHDPQRRTARPEPGQPTASCPDAR